MKTVHEIGCREGCDALYVAQLGIPVIGYHISNQWV